MKPKRKVITIDECMKMSEQELDAFIENDQQFNDDDTSNVDFQGMSIKEIAEKYGCIPIDVAFGRLMGKMNRH